ncbi:adaptin N terminal region-domain-containing protein [Chytriomyces sp. MP71]|nr:adaptin N terminal region-domain-containing protein [Chytriomyces sp. MP71]
MSRGEVALINLNTLDPKLIGYQKKKYVAKLLYMYILGWEVDFGFMEMVDLLSSDKYTEKQIGYLAVTLMLGDNADLSRLIVNCLARDLQGNSEIFTCLALHAIANVGSRDMAMSLSADVQQLLVSGNHTSFVRKKAALCLLRLYRKFPDIFMAIDWAPKILLMMDDRDLGTALGVATLVLALAQQYPEAYYGACAKAINRLHRVLIEKDFTSEYLYYKIPVPWLQVKLLRLLQYFPSPGEPQLFKKLNEVLVYIVRNSAEVPKNVQHNNAQNAILFEAINLCIHLDPLSDLVDQTLVLLGNFIVAKETNSRYLALETMCHLAATGARNCIDALRVHQDTIIASLKDKDISVRRRALDLLYSMCDQSNVRVIVAELLQYLPIADFAIREEMVLKIAILAEKFAMEYSWYVDVVLQLITVAGEFVSDDIWFRVVQIITNNEVLQEYAVATILGALRSPNCHETTVKVGGCILGEFGHLIANMNGCSPIDQFTALHAKFPTCSPQTRALLLTTYVKFINLFPEIKEEILAVFRLHRTVLDVELQQRASEYLALATRETDELMQTVCEEMPAYPERESALLSALNKKIADTEDKRTWIIGGKDANTEVAKAKAIRDAAIAAAAASGAPIGRQRQLANPSKLKTFDDRVQEAPNSEEADIQRAIELSKQEMMNQGQQQNYQVNEYVNSNAQVPVHDALGADVIDYTLVKPVIAPLSGGMDDSTLYSRLVTVSNGLLHRDGNLEIGIKMEYREHLGRIAIFFGNRSSQPITSLAAEIQADPQLRLTLMQPLPSVLPPGTQLNQIYKVECLGTCTPVSFMTVACSVGDGVSSSLPVSLTLRMPILLTKFITPIDLPAHDFFSRWKQIGGPPRESQAVFRPATGTVASSSELVKIVLGLGLGLIKSVDDSPLSTVAAGIFNSADLGKVGCMIRLEKNEQYQMYRLTVRTTNEVVSEILRAQIEECVALHI